MIARIIEDAKVLIPNAQHQNFTEGSEIIKKDTEVYGAPKIIAGLRRGEPFEYKLFATNDNKLIYLNKIQNMETENTTGADSAKGPIQINLKQNMLAKPSIMGAIGGGVIGFGIAKYKKHDMKKAGIYTLFGVVAGFVAGKIVEHTGVVKIGK